MHSFSSIVFFINSQWYCRERIIAQNLIVHPYRQLWTFQQQRMRWMCKKILRQLNLKTLKCKTLQKKFWSNSATSEYGTSFAEGLLKSVTDRVFMYCSRRVGQSSFQVEFIGSSISKTKKFTNKDEVGPICTFSYYLFWAYPDCKCGQRWNNAVLML